jgi:hypothetical protein
VREKRDRKAIVKLMLRDARNALIALKVGFVVSPGWLSGGSGSGQSRECHRISCAGLGEASGCSSRPDYPAGDVESPTHNPHRSRPTDSGSTASTVEWLQRGRDLDSRVLQYRQSTNGFTRCKPQSELGKANPRTSCG